MQLAGFIHFRNKNQNTMRLYNRVNAEELKRRIKESQEERTTISFYQYYHLGNPKIFRDHLYLKLHHIGVLGRIYVSYEGINAQVSVPKNKFEEFQAVLHDITFLENVRLNFAVEDDGKSFFKLAIKVRNKIVADGLDDQSFDVTNKGTHLSAEEFNQLTALEDTTIVDMRNHYEWEVGHFKDAILPDVETFRESLPKVVRMLEDKKDKPVVMYCTGGIRCEKASAYLKHNGFENVYQLEGGIIKYAHDVAQLNIENKFIGKNFVFDERMGEKITDDVIAQCHQCGSPCDSHVNCANDACHILFIQCENCAAKYDNCCSEKCKSFNELPEDKRKELRKSMEFNGTKFGKGRYKAHRKNEILEKIE